MFAWMGGKQRLVALAKHKSQQTQHRGGGAAAAAVVVGGGGMGALPAPTTHQARGVKRSAEDGVGHNSSATAGSERAPAYAAGPSSAAGGGGGCGEHPRPALKRIKRSLDLLALQFPPTWGPASGAAAAAAGGERGAPHAQQALALAAQEGSGATGE